MTFCFLDRRNVAYLHSNPRLPCIMDVIARHLPVERRNAASAHFCSRPVEKEKHKSSSFFFFLSLGKRLRSRKRFGRHVYLKTFTSGTESSSSTAEQLKVISRWKPRLNDRRERRHLSRLQNKQRRRKTVEKETHRAL